MTGLTVLITNIISSGRTGTEMVVRDLALGLKRRGHRPIVYSPTCGNLAKELIDATVAVVDDLAKIAVQPDVIHGHHTFETTMALLRFPGTPALFVCHDWRVWHDEPPIAPLVRQYVAVDETCRDRLTCREGIEAERIRVVHNAVDLERFTARSPLPAIPRRALVFSGYVNESNVLPAIREGCARANLALDAIGGDDVAPERRLLDYDIVFGKARCALEAMAVGTAVILCDQAGFAGLVTPTNFDRLRGLNFGYRALTEAPVTAERIAAAIDQYDAAQASEVQRRVRGVAGLESWLDEVISLYHKIMMPPATTEERDELAAQQPAVDVPFADAEERRLRVEAETLESLKGEVFALSIARRIGAGKEKEMGPMVQQQTDDREFVPGVGEHHRAARRRKLGLKSWHGVLEGCRRSRRGPR